MLSTNKFSAYIVFRIGWEIRQVNLFQYFCFFLRLRSRAKHSSHIIVRHHLCVSAILAANLADDFYFFRFDVFVFLTSEQRRQFLP